MRTIKPTELSVDMVKDIAARVEGQMDMARSMWGDMLTPAEYDAFRVLCVTAAFNTVMSREFKIAS